MSFKEFQSQSRLYVVTGLEFEELEDFERARNEFGQKAELHEAFALSLRPTKATAAIFQPEDYEFISSVIRNYSASQALQR
jgi:hypothetical protein